MAKKKFSRAVWACYGLFLVACVGLLTDLALGTLRSRKLQRLREVEGTSIRLASSVYHHGLKPSLSVTTAWSHRAYRMTTNSMGFRDFESRQVSLKPEGKRILFLGDSFAEGLGVPYEEAAIGIVTRHLRERGVEAENAGVASYCPLFYWLRVNDLLRQGFEFQHLVVLIDVSDIHDETLYDWTGRGVREYIEPGKVAMQQIGHGGLAPFLEGHSILLYPALMKVSDWVRGRKATLPRFGVGYPRALWTVEEGPWNSFGEEGLSRAKLHMGWLNKLLKERGIGLTVVVYPWPDQLYRNDRDSRQVREWGAWARENGARFVNLFPAFFDEREPLDRIEAYFDLPDFHWNPAGHELAARQLISHVDGLGTFTAKGP